MSSSTGIIAMCISRWASAMRDPHCAGAVLPELRKIAAAGAQELRWKTNEPASSQKKNAGEVAIRRRG